MVILCGDGSEPLMVLDADEFVRSLFLESEPIRPYRCCHRPIVVKDPRMTIGKLLRRLKVRSESDDDVIDNDLILLWTGENRRVITGADLLGFLLRGIVPVVVGAGAPMKAKPSAGSTPAP